jgi:cell fate regulator YaaT (PSP1 superfamily)
MHHVDIHSVIEPIIAEPRNEAKFLCFKQLIQQFLSVTDRQKKQRQLWTRCTTLLLKC